MKQNVSGGTHGASKGWQSWPSITGGVCLDTLFHNCHSKQTLENLLSIQGKESRNINRLLNTEKIIYFQHPYHYHQQPVISSTMKLRWDYKLLRLYTVISLFILICVNIWLRSQPHGKNQKARPNLFSVWNNLSEYARGDYNSSNELPYKGLPWLFYQVQNSASLTFDDYSSQPSLPPLTPSPGPHHQATEGENYETAH